MEKIRVTVQREDRLRAINNLSEAILEVAKALNTAPSVAVTNNVINGVKEDGIGIQVDTEDKVTRTEIIDNTIK